MVAQDTLIVLPVQDAVHAAHTRVLFFVLCGAVSPAVLWCRRTHSTTCVHMKFASRPRSRLVMTPGHD